MSTQNLPERAPLSPKWQFRFDFFDRHGGPASPGFKPAFKALPSFEGRSSVRTWLLGIARRTCADHLRAVVRRRRLDAKLAEQARTDLPVPDPAHRLSTADLLSGLSDERRTAFVLTQVLGLSYAEAAEVEDVPVGTIRSRVARARDELVTAVSQARAV
jgi:RNA polymerase sigma-70 factor (ECF subfamily)